MSSGLALVRYARFSPVSIPHVVNLPFLITKGITGSNPNSSLNSAFFLSFKVNPYIHLTGHTQDGFIHIAACGWISVNLPGNLPGTAVPGRILIWPRTKQTLVQKQVHLVISVHVQSLFKCVHTASFNYSLFQLIPDVDNTF